MKLNELKVLAENKTSLAVFTSILLALILISIDFLTSDMTNHLFFADHYLNDWFSLYQPQIGGGLDVGTYPPLSYQIIAFLTFFIPLEASYWIITVSFWIIISFFTSKIISNYLELEESLWFVYLVVFSNIGILKTIFVHGQMTTIVGLGFGSIAVFFLIKAVDSMKKFDFLIFAVSYALTGLSHHFSFLLISFLLPFTLFYKLAFTETRFLKLFIPSIGLTAFILTIGLWPFVEDLFLGAATSSTEISHFTRQSIFEMSTKRVKSTFHFVYGISGIALSLPLIAFYKFEKIGKYLKIYSIGLFFLVLGMGPTTPLPKILLYGLDQWVTYDRFALVASIIFSGLLAATVNKYFKIKQYSSKILVLFVIIFVALNGLMLFEAHQLAHGDPVDSINPDKDDMRAYIVDFLGNQSSDYRYQTFGYGVPIASIYLRTESPTLDTWYFSGRDIDWLENSGVGDIDSSNETFVQKFMNHASNESVKYIFTINPKYGPNYHSIMENYGFKNIIERKFEHKRLLVWENQKDLQVVNQESEDKTFLNLIWGTLPPLMLIMWLALLFYRLGLDKNLLFFNN